MGEAMKKKPIFTMLTVIAATMLFLACAKAKPFDYHSDNEIPNGPGLFTKEKGEFTIYDSKKKQVEAPEEQKVAAQPSTQVAPEESDSFQQFQEWQKDQKEFEAFQEWKRSQEGSQDYKEFQEWKRWREYKRWNDEQKKSNKIDY